MNIAFLSKRLLPALILVFGLSGAAHATLISIAPAALLGDNSTLDFSAGVDGPIAGNNSLFTNFGLSNVSLIGSFTTAGDTLSSGVFGNALVSRGGQLAISAPGGAMDNLTATAGYAFELVGTATQLGFRIVDQINHILTVQTLLNGAILDSVAYNPSGGFPNPIVFYQSSTAFDELRLLAAPGGDGGWGVDDLTFAGKVPAPATLFLLGAGLFGMGLVRRRAA